MDRAASRRFTIADGMILIAALAVGSVLMRAELPGFLEILRFVRSRFGTAYGPVRPWLSWMQEPGSCLVVPLMLATIALRLREPRPRWRRLAIQPGFVACVACAVSLVPGLAWELGMLNRPGQKQPDWFRSAWTTITNWTDAAVLGAWLMLLLGGRWRAERGWVDRLGRFLGAYWVVLWAVGLAMSWGQGLLRLFS